MSNDLPLGYIKATPESFVVEEIVKDDPPRAVSFCDESLIRGWEGDSYTIFVLSKRRWSTEDAIREVANQLDVDFTAISFYGIKDKQARTSQHIGVKGNFRDAFSHRDISLVQLYGQRHPLKRGGHDGNRFDISVLSTADQINLTAAKSVPNLFGPQRLGRQEGSEQVGRLLLEGRKEEAVKLLLTTMGARAFLRAKKLAGGSWEKALFHPSFAEFSLGFEIEKWQSYLWNKLLQEQIEKLGAGLPDLLPMWHMNEKVLEMYRHLWNPSQLDTDFLDFVNPTARYTMIRPKDFQAEKNTAGWNFKFDLPRAAYATIVLSQMFKVEERHIKQEERYV